MKRSLFLLVLLAGCTHKPAEIREVPVPMPVKCVDPAAIPAEPPRVSERFNGNARHDLEVLAPNAVALREWGRELLTLLEQCVGKAPGS